MIALMLILSNFAHAEPTTIEYPKLPYENSEYLIIDPSWYESGFEETMPYRATKLVILKKLCKRLGFKKFVDWTVERVEYTDALHLNRLAEIEALENKPTVNIIHQLTCK